MNVPKSPIMYIFHHSAAFICVDIEALVICSLIASMRLCVAFLICRIYGQSIYRLCKVCECILKNDSKAKSCKTIARSRNRTFWGKCRMLYEFACIFMKVGSLFSGSLQLSIAHFPALLVFSSGPDYYSCTWFFHC